MKRFLTLLAAATLTSATSLASEVIVPDGAESIVQQQLLTPLAKREKNQSRFSRSRLPAQARRVRVLDESPQKDSDGASFVKFAIDARHGLERDGDEGWRKDTITGCVYPDTGLVFVMRAGAYQPAASVLGKKTKPAPKTTCQNDPAQVASAN